MNRLTFDWENQARIQAVESSFGPGGHPLLRPGRTLIGEGRLRKQCRKKKKTKAFFLFNDILVYGSIILNGRWYADQKILALEDIQVEDVEGNEDLKCHWLIRTPQKSFFVVAQSHDEKQAWMSHVRQCQAALPKVTGAKGASFANSWIPDRAAYKCMRCFHNFSTTRRRHHCRKCGFLVCNACSKKRGVIASIHPTKMQRTCKLCHKKLREEAAGGQRDDTVDEADEVDEVGSSNEEEEDLTQTDVPSQWLDLKQGTWGRMSTAEMYQQTP